MMRISWEATTSGYRPAPGLPRLPASREPGGTVAVVTSTPPPARRGTRPPGGDSGTGTGGHYFAASPEVASERRTVRLALPDLDLELTTDRGVFSGTRIDPGTRLLLQEAPAPPPDTANALDLGCGYGPIATVLARRAPGAVVWAVDVNERAVALAAENALANGAPGVRAVVVDADGHPVPGDAADGWPPFDLIWSNPPIRIGKAALHVLLGTWLGRLAPQGQAVLVVQRHLGADSLASWLAERGHPVERLVSRAGYRLLRVGAAGDVRATP
jgi:16S rRNA (guanine1207-N2)-methyltransferase